MLMNDLKDFIKEVNSIPKSIREKEIYLSEVIKGRNDKVSKRLMTVSTRYDYEIDQLIDEIERNSKDIYQLSKSIRKLVRLSNKSIKFLNTSIRKI